MCEPAPARPIARFRDAALRSQAETLRADGLLLKEIGERMGVSTTLARLLLLPAPPLEPELLPQVVCRHCGRGRVTRPKGLCWPCSMTPAIRTQYGPVSKFGRRGLPAPLGNRPRPEPTVAAPGSAEKLAALIRRAAAGERLWHDGDAVPEREWAKSRSRVFRLTNEMME